MPREPSATGEPGQRALDDPSSGQDDEACLVRAAFDDLDGEAAARAEGSGEPGPGLGLIGEQMGQPGEQPACVADEVPMPRLGPERWRGRRRWRASTRRCRPGGGA